MKRNFNRENIIRMAKEAGFVVDEMDYANQPNCISSTHYLVDDLLEHFARLVAAAEREACATVCEAIVAADEYAYADECAKAIRKRGGT